METRASLNGTEAGMKSWTRGGETEFRALHSPTHTDRVLQTTRRQDDKPKSAIENQTAQGETKQILECVDGLAKFNNAQPGRVRVAEGGGGLGGAPAPVKVKSTPPLVGFGQFEMVPLKCPKLPPHGRPTTRRTTRMDVSEPGKKEEKKSDFAARHASEKKKATFRQVIGFSCTKGRAFPQPAGNSPSIVFVSNQTTKRHRRTLYIK